MWAVSISKMELCDNSIVYDIEAGTGCVAVEMALAVGHGIISTCCSTVLMGMMA